MINVRLASSPVVIVSQWLSCVTPAVLWSLVLWALDGIAGGACAQGTTSAAIAGRILDTQGRGLQGVEVVVRNHATGISMRGVSRAEGRYLVSGLEVGGPYSVTVRRIGLTDARRALGSFSASGNSCRWM